MRFRSRALIAPSALAGTCALVAWWFVLPAAAAPALRPIRFESARGTVRYDIYSPPGAGPADRRPLVVFLHGGRETGRTGSRHLIVGPSVYVHRATTFHPTGIRPPACPDFFLIHYQAATEDWRPGSADAAELAATVEHALANFPIDPDRVSLTGHSSGGSGVWAVAAAEPGRWSAIAPVCGIGEPASAPTLRRVPVWIFQGALDGSDSVANAAAMAAALRACGADVRYTLFPDEGHSVWPRVYLNPDVYAWLTNHRRTGRE
ncbi:MAG TPA: prolyl oligopeptidase family serine peptidase [Urbifossiella sp.]|nr:prolyl oligopeptidase family serine peptidase [Urbifossiella sp.]